ncbi:hypothetical protein D3C76_1689580 [compost metagenome]
MAWVKERIASTGKVSAAGLPAEKGIMPLPSLALRISRIMEGCRPEIRSEKE